MKSSLLSYPLLAQILLSIKPKLHDCKKILSFIQYKHTDGLSVVSKTLVLHDNFWKLSFFDNFHLGNINFGNVTFGKVKYLFGMALLGHRSDWCLVNQDLVGLTRTSFSTSVEFWHMVRRWLKMPMEVICCRMLSSLYLKMARANRKSTLLPSYRNVSQIRSMVCINR